MMRNMSRAAAAIFAATLAGTANAAISVFTTQAGFNGATTDLSQQLYTSPLARTVGSYGYQVTAANGLFPGSNAGNVFMSTNTATDIMGFSGFTGGVSAIGGFFFASNISGAPTSASSITLTVTDNMGSIVEVVLNPTTTSFRGFTSTGTITSLSVAPTQPIGGFVWPSVDDLTLAQATAAVPEPATWAMMIAGFGLVGGTMRRRSTKVAFA